MVALLMSCYQRARASIGVPTDEKQGMARSWRLGTMSLLRRALVAQMATGSSEFSFPSLSNSKQSDLLFLVGKTPPSGYLCQSDIALRS